MNLALTSFYLPSLDKIGVGYQAHYMAQALVRRGHRVTLFSPAPRVDDAAYEHRQVDAGRRFRLHGFAKRLPDVIRKADVGPSKLLPEESDGNPSGSTSVSATHR